MFKKLAAGASATALVIGGLTLGAGFAFAQDPEEPAETSGSLSSGSLGVDTEEISANLDLAIAALNGPVTVEGRDGNGPLVSYTNRTEADPENEAAGTKYCIGFTMPYSTVDELDIDPNGISMSDPLAALALLNRIDAAGGVSLLNANGEGEPVASASDGNDLSPLASGYALGGPAAAVAAGETVTWEAPTPADEPAAAVVICSASSGLRFSGLEPEIGIDKQIIADQINDKIPGGSLDLVTPGSISAGSLETIQGSLGSLTGSSGDDAEESDETPADPAQ